MEAWVAIAVILLGVVICERWEKIARRRRFKRQHADMMKRLREKGYPE